MQAGMMTRRLSFRDIFSRDDFGHPQAGSSTCPLISPSVDVRLHSQLMTEARYRALFSAPIGTAADP